MYQTTLASVNCYQTPQHLIRELCPFLNNSYRNQWRHCHYYANAKLLL